MLLATFAPPFLVRVWAPALAAILVTVPTGAQEPLPEGVNDSVIEQGRQVFSGPANCASCHGEGGQGTAHGPSLIDETWLRGDGSYSDILEQVLHGTARRDSETGNPMPMRGWTPISDEDVHAVSAYVWWRSRARSRDP